MYLFINSSFTKPSPTNAPFPTTPCSLLYQWTDVSPASRRATGAGHSDGPGRGLQHVSEHLPGFLTGQVKR